MRFRPGAESPGDIGGTRADRGDLYLFVPLTIDNLWSKALYTNDNASLDSIMIKNDKDE